MSYKKFRLDINGLRAFAVLSVVLYHFGVPYVSGGFVGVDVFFVISGFLMTGIVLERVDHKGVLDFYIARFLRIVPALVVVVLALMIFGLFALSTNEFEILSKNSISSLLFYSNNYYAIHSSYFDPSSELNLLLHTWSLSVEWQFYIFYPLLVIAIKKLRLPVGISLSVIFAISLAITFMRVTGSREDIFYLLPTRAWEMLAGGLVYMASVRYKLPEWLKNCDGYGIALIVVAVVMLHSNGYWPSYSTFAPVIGAAIVLLANDQNSVFTSNRIAQWAGKISYSVYLWHWPVVVVMKYYDIEFNAINISLGVIASFALGDISYKAIENTLRKKSKLKINLSLFAVVLAVSFFVMFTKGVSFRFSNDLKQVVEYRMDNSPWRPDTCFLNPEQDYSAFSKCQDKMTGKSFVVWGDSHAAHLMPGLRSVFGNSLNITQRNASLCPPLIGPEIKGRPHCKTINDMVAKEIATNKPNTVLISALWSVYPMRNFLPETIKFLKESGVNNIIVVGPFPVWKRTMIDTIEEIGINAERTVPWDMTDETRNLRGNDKYLRNLSKEKNFTYISPLEDMCTDSYCKAIVGHKTAYPIQYDNAHLTPEGAKWFIGKVENQISK
ncbi:acyltransferase family protein [Escherichia coli]|nr:acyltransferase [Escherichia coli]